MSDTRGALTDLLHSYAHYADSFDLDLYIGLFAEDAHIDMMGQVISPTQLREIMQQNQKDTQGCSPRHVLSNLMFTDTTDDSARGAMYYTYQQTLDGKPVLMMSGTYTFELRLIDGRWLISSWRIQADQAA